MVNVTVEAPPLNTTFSNSFAARFVPAKVIVSELVELKITVPVPADHEADVDPFVHAPPMLQVSDPKLM
jgi:hypothetical protein